MRPPRGRVINTGQAVIDLVLRVPQVPAAGGDVFATHYQRAAGGAFNAMAAAARDGAQVLYAGAHGEGPFGDAVRAALAVEGVTILTEYQPGRDTGFSVALVDDHAERTFISTAGAEAHATVDGYRRAAARSADVVYVSGYSLLHEVNRNALLTWLPELPDDVLIVADPSPVLDVVPLEALLAVSERAHVWSTNEREARTLGRLLNLPLPPDAALEVLATSLAAAVGSTVVLRAGDRGAVLVSCHEGVPAEPVVVEALRVEAVDTNGAGDAHCGVLCAALAAGSSLFEALRRASVASGVAVSRFGPATSPTTVEIDALLGKTASLPA